jgi:FMN phosphatase YigB (HAD superfamily)
MAGWYSLPVLKAITIDFWNTLFVDHRGRERAARRGNCLHDELSDLGLARSDAELADSLAAGYAYFDRIWRAEMRTPDAAEILDVMLEGLRARLPQAARARIVRTFGDLVLELPPEPLPRARETLEVLAAHYKLAVVCDAGFSPGRSLRELLVRNDMLAPFAYLYFSDEGGMSKPDPRVFTLVLEQLGVHAQEAAHVGDMERTDIAGAHAAGMLAVLFTGANHTDAEGTTADLVVPRFADLPALVGGLVCPGC